MVLSGKGGVGKTFVAVNLALALRDLGYSVGILDIDLHGPNVPILLGATEGAIYADENMRLIPIEAQGIKVMSVRYLLEKGVPLIRRGSLKSKLINDMVSKTARGKLDFLVIDSPPGTGDEFLSAVSELHIDRGIVVSTPQRVAIADVERAVGALRRLDIIPAGVVLNMAYVVCPKCGHRISLATVDREELLEEMKKAMLYNELEKKILDRKMRGVKVDIKDPKEAKKKLDEIRHKYRKEAEAEARRLVEIKDIKKIEEELASRGLKISLKRIEEFDILAELPLDVESLKAIDEGRPLSVNEEIRKKFLEIAKRFSF